MLGSLKAAILLVIAALTFSIAAGSSEKKDGSYSLVNSPFYAQAIFDEEPESQSEESTTEDSVPETVEEKKNETYAIQPKKSNKKKARKVLRKIRKASENTSVSQTPAHPDYSPEELARQSYIWAPDTEWKLKSSIPGIGGSTLKPVATPAETMTPDEARPRTQGFKLPQIPLTQVLIVAGFAILFLIYRLRVGRQIKRKKY